MIVTALDVEHAPRAVADAASVGTTGDGRVATRRMDVPALGGGLVLIAGGLLVVASELAQRSGVRLILGAGLSLVSAGWLDRVSVSGALTVIRAWWPQRAHSRRHREDAGSRGV